jgi:glutamate-1-semialdehyde 2,1-aminomutase
VKLVRRAVRALNPVGGISGRLSLSRAKHRSLAGHPGLASRLARSIRQYSYELTEALAIDGAPAAVQRTRAAGLDRLESLLRTRAPRTVAASRDLSIGLSDAQLISRCRVPFQFRECIAGRLDVGMVVATADGVELRDLDGNTAYDLGGSYGVNLFGHDVYRRCIDEAVERARETGLVLGNYHPVVMDNVARLRGLSGMDEVSFHMSGTEAVMQAVRLARYHTGRTHVVRFAGAYHGWGDGLQVGPGNPLAVRSVYTLEELSDATLHVLRTRDDIACVIVNPLQALTPNRAPATDAALVSGVRHAGFDRTSYTRWLRALRRVCDERGIALIFDEVFVGFRLAKGGAQEFFGVQADLVAYGKTIGGGLPVGVVCGRRDWMRRYRHEHPADVCFARGTFVSHPYVMTAMNAMLRHLDSADADQTWVDLEGRWNRRAARWNAALEATRVPPRVANFTSVFITTFAVPGRFHWLLQYYLRAEGLSTAWVGTGRFILSHDYTDDQIDEVIRRFTRASQAMEADGWFWRDPAATEASIRRSIAREILRASFMPRRSPAAVPSASQPAPTAAAPPAR